MDPLKQKLAEKISLQRSNCNIFGLTHTVALLAYDGQFLRFRVNFGECYLQNEVDDPHLFAFFEK